MFTTSPLSDGFGARLHGADLATPLADDDFAAIEAAFYAAQVLVLPAQHLTPSQFVAWARRFGAPEPHVIDQFHHPADPNILILTNRRNDRGEPLGLADGGTYFHTDYSYLTVPARATTLYSLEVPGRGGSTLFADQYAAYAKLRVVTGRHARRPWLRLRFRVRRILPRCSARAGTFKSLRSS